MEGLLSFGKEKYITKATSFILVESKAIPVTCSILVSVSAGQSNAASLYSIRINRVVGSSQETPPTVSVKVLDGSYSVKISYKLMSDGSFRIYLKKPTNTPVVWCKLLNQFGISDTFMSEVSLSEIEDSIEVEAS